MTKELIDKIVEAVDKSNVLNDWYFDQITMDEALEEIRSILESIEAGEVKGINLTKLTQQLDDALAKETPESFNAWLKESGNDVQDNPTFPGPTNL